MDPQQFPELPNVPGPSDQPAEPSQPTSAPPQQPDSQRHVRNPLAVMQPGEQVVCEIRRHPIGMLGVYIMSGLILIVLAVVALVVIPQAAGPDSHGKAMAAGGLLFVVIAAFVLIFVFIANKVYWGNHWVVTSDSITQISQISLFNRQSSQLSMGNLEDVTTQQRGILQQLFKFGTIKAETAGERSKFVFPFCPNPDYYAQKILAAREVFEQAHHGGKQEPYLPPQVPAMEPAVPTEPGTAFGNEAQYQVGQTPPIFGSQPPSPSIEPTPQSPSGEGPAPSQTPSSYPDPDQQLGGLDKNIPQ